MLNLLETLVSVYLMLDLAFLQSLSEISSNPYLRRCGTDKATSKRTSSGGEIWYSSSAEELRSTLNILNL